MFSRSGNPLLTSLLSYHVRVTSKIQLNFRYRRYSKVLMILSYKFLKFLQYSCFRGQGIHCWHSYWATMFAWPRTSRSTSGTGGTDDSVLWIFEISSIFMFSRSRNPLLAFLLSYHVWVTSKIQLNFRYRRYSKVLMILSYKFLKFLQYSCFRGQGIHCWHSYWATMFAWPRKSRSTSGTGGTDDSVLWIFEISSIFMFSRSRNPLLAFLLSYHVWVTSKIQLNFRYRRYSKVLMILSYKFLKFLQYSCFRGQEIHCWHSYWATMFGWLRKSRSTSGTGGTDDSVLWIFEISSIFMFSRSRNPLLAFLLSNPVRVTLEI